MIPAQGTTTKLSLDMLTTTGGRAHKAENRPSPVER